MNVRFLDEAHAISRSMDRPNILQPLSTHLKVKTGSMDKSTSLKVTKQSPPRWILLQTATICEYPDCKGELKISSKAYPEKNLESNYNSLNPSICNTVSNSTTE